MPGRMTQLAEQIASPATDPAVATLRIATVTNIEITGKRRAQTDATSTAWLSRDSDTEIRVGDRVWLLQQGAVWLIGGRLGGGSATPIGVINSFAGSSAPLGWLMCDGSAVSRTEYSALFSVIGTSFGAGNGSTTFNVPNLLDRVPVGSGSAYARGNQGGASSVTLGAQHIPGHDHGNSGSHTHSYARAGGTTTVQSGTGATVASSGGGTTGSSTHTHSWFGGGQAHENMPPYLAMPYIIRAL